MHRVNDASSSHILAITSGVFPDALCPWLAPGPRLVVRDSRRLRLAAPAPSPCRPPCGGLHEKLAFLEFPCPSTFEQMQRPLADSTCVSSSSHRGYLPDFAASSEFRTPSTLHSATCLPALFRAGAVHGLSYLRRFLPVRSPANLSVPGVLRVVIPLARHRLRGFQHRPDACRRFVGLALAPLAPPLVVFPFEVCTFRSRSALPRRSSHGLPWVPRIARPCGFTTLRPLNVLFRVSENLKVDSALASSPSVGFLPTPVPALRWEGRAWLPVDALSPPPTARSCEIGRAHV